MIQELQGKIDSKFVAKPITIKTEKCGRNVSMSLSRLKFEIKNFKNCSKLNHTEGYKWKHVLHLRVTKQEKSY